jgi:hypothetical protein
MRSAWCQDQPAICYGAKALEMNCQHQIDNTMRRGWLKYGNPPGDPSVRRPGTDPWKSALSCPSPQRKTALSDARRQEHQAADARRPRA